MASETVTVAAPSPPTPGSSYRPTGHRLLRAGHLDALLAGTTVGLLACYRRRRFVQVGPGMELADQVQPALGPAGEVSHLVAAITGVAGDAEGAVREPAQQQTQQDL